MTLRLETLNASLSLGTSTKHALSSSWEHRLFLYRVLQGRGDGGTGLAQRVAELYTAGNSMPGHT